MASPWRIPLFATEFGEEERRAVLRPLERGWLTMGPEVEALEEDLCALTGSRNAIAVANGTAALHLASHGLDLKGTEVICPALTFVASASAPYMAGATLSFCDVTGPEDLTMSIKSVARMLTPATKALMAVHYAGFSCDIAGLTQLAEEHGLLIIEDCAHALFSTEGPTTLGRIGAAGCFSFFSNKNATCGEGGAVITDDDALAARLRWLRSHGMTAGTAERHTGRVFGYDVLEPGFNFRLDEIRAALLRVQLSRLDRYLARRRELFLEYVQIFEGTTVDVPFSSNRHEQELENTSVHIMAVLLPEGVDRHVVARTMRDDGIQTSHHYPPVHHLSAFQGAPADALTIEALAPRLITLPLYPLMTNEDVHTVAGSLMRAVDVCGNL